MIMIEAYVNWISLSSKMVSSSLDKGFNPCENDI